MVEETLHSHYQRLDLNNLLKTPIQLQFDSMTPSSTRSTSPSTISEMLFFNNIEFSNIVLIGRLSFVSLIINLKSNNDRTKEA
jgi:hypothetical protein